mgnify:CR=1 FL=1
MDTVTISIERYEELIATEVKHRMIKRYMERKKYISDSDLRTILEMDEKGDE